MLTAQCASHTLQSFSEATAAFVRAGRMHRKVTPIKAGRSPAVGEHVGLKTARLHLGLGEGGGREGQQTQMQTRREAQLHLPRHPQQLGRRPRRWEQREPRPQVCSERLALGPHNVPVHRDRRPARRGGASLPTPRPLPTKQLPQHPAPHPAPKSPVGWPDGSGEVGTSTENGKQWPPEPETALALHHPIFLSPFPPLPHTRVQTFGGSGALARRRWPTSRMCKAVLVGQGQGIIHPAPNA